MNGESTEQRYEELLRHLDALEGFERSLAWRSMKKTITSPRDMMKLSRYAYKHNPLSSKSPEVVRDTYRQVATNAERAHPLFPVLSSEYRSESFAAFVIGEMGLGKGEVENLLRIQEEKKKRLERYNVKVIFGIVLTALTLVSQTVPEELFKYYEWDYAGYKIVLFFVTVIALVYLGVVSLPAFVRYNRAKRRLEACETLLAYCAIVGAARGGGIVNPSG